MKVKVRAILRLISRSSRKLKHSFVQIAKPLRQIFPNARWRFGAGLFMLSFIAALGFALTNQPHPAYGAAAVSKVFAPNVVNPGEKSRATITITNNNNFALTNAGITDAMPSAIKIYNPANATTTCGAGSIVAVPGTSTVTMSGGTVPATVGATTGSCTISYDVYSSASGTTQNSNIPPGSLTNTQNDTNGNLDVSLTIRPITYNAVTGSKVFSPNSFAATQSSTVTITLSNPLNAIALDGATMADNLPSGLTATGTPVTTCNNGITVPNPGATTVTNTGGSVTLNNGQIPANGSCTITFSVTGTIPATYTNTIANNALTTFQGAGLAAGFSSNVTITQPVSLAKSFSINPIKQGDISRATVTITNNSTVQLTNLTVPDNLGSPASGLLYRSDTAPSTTCTGGTVNVTGASGTAATITLQNATLNAGQSCTFSFDVTSRTLGSRTNTITAASITNTQNFKSVNDATANLTVDPLLTIVKSYSDSPIAVGGDSNLIIAITNPANSNVDPVSNISFSDGFNTSGRVVLLNTGAGAGTSTCGGIINGTSSNGFTFTGGSIAKGVTCTLTIPIRGVSNGSTTNTIAQGDVISTQLVTNAVSNSPSITVGAPLTVAKTYSNVNPRQGDPVILTIALRNYDPRQATNVTLTDVLDPRLEIVTTASPDLITTAGVIDPQFILVDSTSGNAITPNTCSGTLSAPRDTAGPTISLTNGVIPPGSTSNPTRCDIRLSVRTDIFIAEAGSPAPVPPDRYRNIIPPADATASYDGGVTTTQSVPNSSNLNQADINPDTNPAVDIFSKQFSVIPPYATASFADNVTTVINTPIKVRYTLRNRSAQISPVINLNDALNAGFKIYRPGTAGFEPTTNCTLRTNSGGTTTTTVTPNFTGTVNNGTSFIMTGGAIRANGGSCIVEFFVISTQENGTTGVPYTNPIRANDLVSTNPSVVNNTPNVIYNKNTGVGPSAIVNSPLTIGKGFSVASTSINTNATATVTLTNTYTTAAVGSTSLTNLGFTDNLPTNLRAVPGTTGGSCVTVRGGTATITQNVGVNQDRVTLTGATLPQGQSCTVTFDVTSSVVANYTGATANTIDRSTQVTNDQLVPAQQSATASIDFLAGLNITKTFDNATSSTIVAGQTSILRIAISNTSGQNLSTVSLDDNLPANVLIAPTPGTSAINCGSPTFTADPSTNLFRITNASISNGATCTLAVTVTSSVPNAGYVNTIPANAVNTGVGVSNTSPASATLVVNTPLGITKSFNSSTIGVNGISTVTLTISNQFPSAVNFTSSPVGLTDTWTAANLQIANPPNASTTCAGGTVSAVAGQKTVTLSGGQIPAGSVTVPGVCLVQFDVTATATTPTPVINTIPANNLSTIQGYTNSTAATANLTITTYSLIVGKSFNPSTIDGGTPTILKVDIENPSNGIPLTNLRFVDNMPAGMIVYSVPNPIVSANCPGGVISATPGAGSFSFSGGSLGVNQTCTITLNVTSVQQGTLTNSIPPSNFTNNEGVLSKEGIGYPATVAANFSVLPSAEFAKEFDLPSIAPGGVASLKITVANTATAINLTGMNFQDNLPSGLIVAPTPNIRNNGCNGTITANPGSSVIQLSNGSLAASVACSIQVDVTAANPGLYTNSMPAGALQTAQSISNKQPATTLFPVQVQPTIAKAFNPSNIPLGGTSQMTITITNPHTSGLVNVNLDDNLPTNLVVAPIPNLINTCNGSVAAASNTGLVRLTNGSISASSSCTIQVDVTSGVGGNYTNTIPARALTASVVNGVNPPVPGPTNINPASATLSNTPVATNPPNLLLIKRVTALNSTNYTTVIDDGVANNEDNDPKWPSNYLQGQITLTGKPGDQIEYTIYFLNNGGSAAQSVRICDAIQSWQDFVPNTYTGVFPQDNPGSLGDSGIALKIGTGSELHMSNISDPPDRGEYVPSPTVPTNCNTSSNPNGTVVVDVTRNSGSPTFPSLPNATAAGTPTDSYGYIRFRTKAK
jgi:uncharacterized repeat protein (TIGR01451 family)